MARRVSALVTVTAASSGSCPSLEFVSFIVEDSFSVASHYIQIICAIYLYAFLRTRDRGRMPSAMPWLPLRQHERAPILER